VRRLFAGRHARKQPYNLLFSGRGRRVRREIRQEKDLA